MAKRVPFKHKRKEAPEWVFPWRPLGQSPFPNWFALLLVGSAFAFFLTSVRIHVTPPTPWATHKASVIQVTDDAEGRALTLRAREGGPFPARFEPAVWEGTAVLKQAAMDAARWSPPAYVPALRDLPDEVTPPLSLAGKGEAVLPKRKPSVNAVPETARLKLAPTLYPLSGISPAAMPRELPAYDGAVDAKMTPEPTRFLVRLDTAGNVRDCVSLAGGASPLEDWLRRVTFNPEPAKPSRWIAVGVGFTNQPADGPDAR